MSYTKNKQHKGWRKQQNKLKSDLSFYPIEEQVMEREVPYFITEGVQFLKHTFFYNYRLRLSNIPLMGAHIKLGNLSFKVVGKHQTKYGFEFNAQLV